MLYNLILVVFLSGNVEHRFPLIYKVSDETCIDLRDSVRENVDYLNNLEELKMYRGKEIEFVDAECVARSNYY